LPLITPPLCPLRQADILLRVLPGKWTGLFEALA
jgi:hypothetical protein